MKLKRILALAVSIAMVLAIVPAFTLTASAEDIVISDLTMADWHKYAGEPVFTAPSVSGDVKVAEAYGEGWSAAWNGNNTDSADGYVNINANSAALQVYGPTGSSDTLVMPGFGADKDFVIVEFWQTRPTGAQAFSHDFKIMDIDGEVIETGSVSQQGGLYSGEFTNDTMLNKPHTYADVHPEAADEATKATKISTGYHMGQRVVFVNNGDETYSVIYYNAGGEQDLDPYRNNYKNKWDTTWTKAYTATYKGSFNGIGSIEYTVRDQGSAWYNNHQMNDLRIYAGDLPASVEEANAIDALIKLEVASMANEEITLPDSVDDYDVEWTAEPEGIIDVATGEVTPADDVVVVSLVPSTSLEDGTTVTGAARKVTVFPASLANGEYAIGSVAYDIDETPIVTLDNVNDATNATKLSESDGWTHSTVGDVTYHTTKNGAGSGSANSARAEFTIDADTDYIAAITYKGIGYGNGMIKSEYNWDNGTLATFPGTTDWKRDVVYFNSGENTTIYFMFAWLSANTTAVQNFEVYKLTEKDDYLVSTDKPEAVSVATGGTPVLPATVTGHFKKGDEDHAPEAVSVEWDLAGVDFTNDSDEVKVVTVNGTATDGLVKVDAAVDVNVYYSYTYEDQINSVNGQDPAKKSATKFPAPADSVVSATFSATYSSFGDLWIQFGDSTASGDLFSGGACQVGLGSNAGGAFRPVDGNGTGGRNTEDADHGIIKAGTAYDFIVNIDVVNKKYTVAAYDAVTGEELGKAEDFGFRSNRDQIDAMYVFTNNGNGAITVSDLKITYAEAIFPETVDVTVEYYVDDTEGSPVETATKTVRKGGSPVFDAVELVVDGVFYEAEEITVSEVEEETTEKVVLTPVEGKAIATSVFTLENGSLFTLSGSWGDGTNGVFNSGWNTARVGYIFIPMALDEEDTIADITLSVDVVWTQGTNAGSYFYLADPAKIDLENHTVEADAQLDEVGSFNTKSSSSNGSGAGKQVVTLNAELINKYFAEYETDGLYLIAFGQPANSNSGVSLRGAGYGENSPYVEWTLKAPVLPVGVTMIEGAQVRLGASENGKIDTATSGLRFIGTIDGASDDSYAKIAKDNLGVRIYADEIGSDQYVDIAIEKWQNEETFTVALVNLKEANYNRVFVAVPYAVVDGVKVFDDAPSTVARSIYEVSAGILVKAAKDDESNLEYDVNKDVQKVLNAYVNAVGVRVSLNKEATEFGVDHDHYAYGKDTDKPEFFTVEASKEGNKYTITITPAANVTLDEAAMKANLRVNNNHSAIEEALESLTIDEAGAATFTFTYTAE